MRSNIAANRTDAADNPPTALITAITAGSYCAAHATPAGSDPAIAPVSPNAALNVNNARSTAP